MTNPARLMRYNGGNSSFRLCPGGEGVGSAVCAADDWRAKGNFAKDTELSGIMSGDLSEHSVSWASLTGHNVFRAIPYLLIQIPIERDWSLPHRPHCLPLLHSDTAGKEKMKRRRR